MENAEASFAQLKAEHDEDMSHLQQELDAADAKKKLGIKVVYEASLKHSTARKEEQRAHGRKLAAEDLSNTPSKLPLFSVPDGEWVELKYSFVDCGLDEHPYVIENGIKLTKQKQSVETCKTMVALALGIETSVPPPEEEQKRLVEEAAIDGDDDDDSVKPPKKKMKFTEFVNFVAEQQKSGDTP
eukprot:scaffold14498_cov120-Amphora_coffeaeformis.AAC.1